LKFEFHDKLPALAQLAKVLSFTADHVPVSVQNTQVNVGQVNIGQDNALEGLRRLAFAIEKPARAQEAGLLDAPSHAPDRGAERVDLNDGLDRPAD
jgi:hypothetical protein